MPRTFTLLELRTRVLDLADLEGARDPSSTELNDKISAAYAKYYAKITKAGLGYPGESTQTIATTGTDTYALNADHFATQRVDYQIDNTPRWGELDEVDVREVTFYPPTAAFATGFRLVGTNIVFYPTPPSGQTYRHIYVPAPAKLTADGQTVDGVCGWEELLVLDVVLKLKGIKYEEEASLVLEERNKMEADLDEQIAMRILTRHKRIVQRRWRKRWVDPTDYWHYATWRDEY